jgi:hypothetical protein
MNIGFKKNKNNQPESKQNMKQILTSFKLIAGLMLLILAIGCATTKTAIQSKEDMLIASGFKTITPKNATQQQKLQALPPGHIAMIQKAGKTFYVFPDAAQNLAYVGGPAEYQAYQQARAAKNLADENLATAEMYQDSSMEWGAYNGWGAGWGGMGMGAVAVRR